MIVGLGYPAESSIVTGIEKSVCEGGTPMSDGSGLEWVNGIWILVKVGLILIFASGLIWQFRHRHK